MKKTLILLIGIVALSAVAVAQNVGTTTTSITCDASGIGGQAGPPVVPPGANAGACSVQGQTMLIATVPEGLSINVPNEIDFTLIPNTVTGNIGSQPLTINTAWNLATYNTATTSYDPMGYSTVYVDAWFDDSLAGALSATDGSGNVIDFATVMGTIGTGGPLTAFGVTPANNPALSAKTYAFPVDVYTVDSTTGVGSGVDVVNLYIDTTAVMPPSLAPPAVYKGYVFTTAAAL